jgi:hypothetical protein
MALATLFTPYLAMFRGWDESSLTVEHPSRDLVLPVLVSFACHFNGVNVESAGLQLL